MPRDRQNPQPQPAKPPVKILYLLTKNGERTYWNRAGVGFVNNDASINLKLDIFPDVQFQLRDQREKEE